MEKGNRFEIQGSVELFERGHGKGTGSETQCAFRFVAVDSGIVAVDSDQDGDRRAGSGDDDILALNRSLLEFGEVGSCFVEVCGHGFRIADLVRAGECDQHAPDVSRERSDLDRASSTEHYNERDRGQLAVGPMSAKALTPSESEEYRRVSKSIEGTAPAVRDIAELMVNLSRSFAEPVVCDVRGDGATSLAVHEHLRNRAQRIRFGAAGWASSSRARAVPARPVRYDKKGESS